MLEILSIVGPVFLLVGSGYLSVILGWFPVSGVSGVIKFVNGFAVPCLLFEAMRQLDFFHVFDVTLLMNFYLGALVSFVLVLVVTLKSVRLSLSESIVVGFSGYFTNTVLLGLPIIDRTFGSDALPTAYAIIGLHSPLLMTIGMLVMEFTRREGTSKSQATIMAAQRILTNPLLIGIALGMTVNLLNISVPLVITDATQMMAAAVLPAALFGLGGALTTYRLMENWSVATLATTAKLVIHPSIVLLLSLYVFHLPWALTQVAVLMAAMPAGLNVYVFASTYNRAMDIAANTILISTAAGVFSISVWLWVLQRLAVVYGY